MTAFLQCFWISPPDRFCFKSEHHELVWKSVWSILHRNLVSKIEIFLKKIKFETWFPDFSDSRPKKIGFWGLGTFLHVFWVQKIIDLFTIWRFFYKFWKMSHKSFSYEPSRQYGINPFLKTIIKHRNDCKRGIGKILIFFNWIAYCIAYLLYCIAYCIAYSIVLPVQKKIDI